MKWKLTSSTGLKASIESVAPFPPALTDGEILRIPVPASHGHGGDSPRLLIDGLLLVAHFYYRSKNGLQRRERNTTKRERGVK